MKYNDSDYKSIDSDLCTEETNDDDIVLLLSRNSENEGVSDDDTKKENAVSVPTSTIANFSAAIKNVQNLTLFAAKHGDTVCSFSINSEYTTKNNFL